MADFFPGWDQLQFGGGTDLSSANLQQPAAPAPAGSGWGGLGGLLSGLQSPNFALTLAGTTLLDPTASFSDVAKAAMGGMTFDQQQRQQQAMRTLMANAPRNPDGSINYTKLVDMGARLGVDVKSLLPLGEYGLKTTKEAREAAYQGLPTGVRPAAGGGAEAIPGVAQAEAAMAAAKAQPTHFQTTDADGNPVFWEYHPAFGVRRARQLGDGGAGPTPPPSVLTAPPGATVPSDAVGGAPAAATPGTPGAAAAGPPPGMSRTQYQQQQQTLGTERAKAQVTRETQAQAGQQVMAAIDQLERKFIDPETGKPAVIRDAKGNPVMPVDKILGPVQAAAAEGNVLYNPARMIYEAAVPAEAKGYMDRIRSDAQAIQSQLQRAILSGQGQVTEAERESINRIMGNIAAARSVEDAKAQLDNLRGLIRGIFQMSGGGPSSSGGWQSIGDTGIRYRPKAQ